MYDTLSTLCMFPLWSAAMGQERVVIVWKDEDNVNIYSIVVNYLMILIHSHRSSYLDFTSCQAVVPIEKGVELAWAEYRHIPQVNMGERCLHMLARTLLPPTH